MGEGKKLSGGIIALVILGVLILGGGILGIVVGGGMWGTYQRANNLRVDFEAQKQAIELNVDKVWKVIKSKAEISDKYADTYKGMIRDMTAGRYENGTGQLMANIAESNPSLDLSILKDLGNTIEGMRNENELVQKKAVSLQAEYNKITTGNFFGIILKQVGVLKDLELLLITSTHTKNAVETGKDDDVDLFKDKDGTSTPAPADTVKKEPKEVKVPDNLNLLVSPTGIAPTTPAKK